MRKFSKMKYCESAADNSNGFWWVLKAVGVVDNSWLRMKASASLETEKN